MPENRGFKFERDPDGDVAIFTVCGSTRLNLVGIDTLTQCAEGIQSHAENSELRCAILQGMSDHAFIGGADLKEIEQLEPHNAAEFVSAIHHLCSILMKFPVPVIARIQGYCLGGGLEIAAACDFRICDSTGIFGMPEVKVGVPSVVEAALLPRLIGRGKTRELVLRGNLINAAEAHRIGLVEQFVEHGTIDAAVAASIGDIVDAAPNAIRLQKKLCQQWEDLSTSQAIEAGLPVFAQAFETDEPRLYCQRFFDRNKLTRSD